MKYKFDKLTSQEDLERILDEVRNESKKNYEDASQRTQAKLEAMEENVKMYKAQLVEANNKFTELELAVETYEAELAEAYEANNTYELADMLNEHQINPKFNDLVIQAGGLSSDMDPEEFMQAISMVKESYPEFALNEKQPTKAPEELGDGKDPQSFDTNMTYQ